MLTTKETIFHLTEGTKFFFMYIVCR